MKCYIVSGRSGIDISFLNQLGAEVIDSVPCTNCVVAKLESWQIQELRASGYDVTLDRTCSI